MDQVPRIKSINENIEEENGVGHHSRRLRLDFLVAEEVGHNNITSPHFHKSFFWNCKDIERPNITTYFKGIIRNLNPSFMFFLETK